MKTQTIQDIDIKKYAERFWAKVVITADTEKCWFWFGHIKDGKYGQFHVERHPVYAHHFAYFLFYGKVSRLKILHKCDKPACVNPYHLFEGTQADNIADKVAKDRQPKGESCYNAKVSDLDVIKLRQRKFKFGEKTQVAKELGITRQHLYDIVNGVKRL